MLRNHVPDRSSNANNMLKIISSLGNNHSDDNVRLKVNNIFHKNLYAFGVLDHLIQIHKESSNDRVIQLINKGLIILNYVERHNIALTEAPENFLFNAAVHLSRTVKFKLQQPRKKQQMLATAINIYRRCIIYTRLNKQYNYIYEELVAYLNVVTRMVKIYLDMHASSLVNEKDQSYPLKTLMKVWMNHVTKTAEEIRQFVQDDSHPVDAAAEQQWKYYSLMADYTRYKEQFLLNLDEREEIKKVNKENILYHQQAFDTVKMHVLPPPREKDINNIDANMYEYGIDSLKMLLPSLETMGRVEESVQMVNTYIIHPLIQTTPDPGSRFNSMLVVNNDSVLSNFGKHVLVSVVSPEKLTVLLRLITRVAQLMEYRLQSNKIAVQYYDYAIYILNFAINVSEHSKNRLGTYVLFYVPASNIMLYVLASVFVCDIFLFVWESYIYIHKALFFFCIFRCLISPTHTHAHLKMYYISIYQKNLTSSYVSLEMRKRIHTCTHTQLNNQVKKRWIRIMKL